MKVSYDRTTDILSIVLRDDRAIAESDEDKPGVILDWVWLFCIDDFLAICGRFSAVESRPAPFSGGQRQATPAHTPVRVTCRAGSHRTVVCLLRPLPLDIRAAF